MIEVEEDPWCPDLDKIRTDLDKCQVSSFVSGVGWFEHGSEDEFEQNDKFNPFASRYNRYLSFLGLLILAQHDEAYHA